MLAAPLPINRQRRLFYLLTHRGIPICYGVGALSLPIPHGMHLVVPTRPYFFWIVCHLSMTFPPKKLEREPQNRFSPLPTARPYLLTSDPWPITSCIGWVQAGDVWALHLLHSYVRLKLVPCSCVCYGLEAHLCILPLILDPLWHELLSDFSFLTACFFQGLGLAWLWAFPSFKPILCSFHNPTTFFYHTILLFLPWCYLTHDC